jgi:hypothetical protein
MISLKRISRFLLVMTALSMLALTTAGSALAQSTPVPASKQTPVKSAVGAAEGGVTYYYRYAVKGGGQFSCPGNLFYSTPFGQACKGVFFVQSKCVGGRVHIWYRGAIFNRNTATVGSLGPLKTLTKKC